MQIQGDYIDKSTFIERAYPFMSEQQRIFITVRVSRRARNQVKKCEMDGNQKLDDGLIKDLCLPPI